MPWTEETAVDSTWTEETAIGGSWTEETAVDSTFTEETELGCSEQDFTGYTETDPSNYIYVTDDLVAYTDTVSAANVASDLGTSFFGDAFSVKFRINIDEIVDAVGLWGVANSSATLTAEATNSEGITVSVDVTDSVNRLILRVDGTDEDEWTGIHLNTDYWLKVVRDGTLVTCSVYADSSLSTLRYKLSATCPTTSYRYNYIAKSKS